MSHPWKAQPYYLVQQPRTSGTVPAPLGSFGVRAALAGYTRGVFAPKSPWNVPKYVAAEPTGVDGFRGFGRFRGFGQAAACVPAEQLAAELMKTVEQVLATVQLPSWAAEKLSAPTAQALWIRVPEANRLAALTRAVNTLAGLASTGRERVTAFFAGLFAQLADALQLKSPVELTWPGVKIFLPPPTESTPWRELGKQAQAGLWGDALQTSVCSGTTVSGTYAKFGPGMCSSWCMTPAAGGLPTGKPEAKVGLPASQAAELDEWCSKTCGIQVSVYTGPLPPSLEEQRRQLVAAGLRVAKLKLATPTPVAAPVKKTSPLLIVGAAALAALMLLK